MSNKKYYWLKLNDNFFEEDTIVWLEEQENGKDYVNFYLKLLLKSLREEGRLVRYVGERIMPYDTKSLAKLTNVNPDTVAVAMKVFIEIGLVEQLDTGELYFTQIDEMIGSETRQASIMRRKRALEKIEKEEEVTLLQDVTKSYTEIEKEIEIELDINKVEKAKCDVELTLKDGSKYFLDDDYYNDLITLHGKKITDSELLKMKIWLNSNPGKQKTKSGMKRFITNWLNRNDKPKNEPVKKQVKTEQIKTKELTEQEIKDTNKKWEELREKYK